MFWSYEYVFSVLIRNIAVIEKSSVELRELPPKMPNAGISILSGYALY